MNVTIALNMGWAKSFYLKMRQMEVSGKIISVGLVVGWVFFGGLCGVY